MMTSFPLYLSDDNIEVSVKPILSEADELYMAGKYSEAARLYKQVASINHVRSQYMVGLCLVNISNCPYIAGEYEEWFRKASQEYNPWAEFFLNKEYSGSCLEAVSAANEAMRYYLRAKKGNAVAEYSLGICYAEGKGVAKNMEQAVSWFSRSASKHDKYALYD